MEADEVVRVVELELGEFDQEIGDQGCLVGLEAIFRGFELSEEIFGIVGSRRHGPAIV